MNIFYKLCIFLIILGGLNWGCIGLFGLNIVAFLLGGTEGFVARTIFTLIGVASLCSIPVLFSGTPRKD